MISSAIAILGPTASGKTALALQLARYFPLEIISLDSALVYRGMDIGTAKPTQAERVDTVHHLIDIISPIETYSAADFVKDCVRLVQEIRLRGKIPLIVGGTMMYFHALTQGLNSLPEADEAVRTRLQQEKQAYGLAHLYQRLKSIDAITAARLEPNDSQRIERALEVFELTGKPLSAHFSEQQTSASSLRLLTLALLPENRELLHTTINKRFEQMLAMGFLAEVERLQQDYPTLQPDMPSIRCVGYRQAWAYLAGKVDKATLIAQGQAATRQLAKRQLTWLRKLPYDLALDPYGQTDIFQAAYHAVARFEQGIDA